MAIGLQELKKYIPFITPPMKTDFSVDIRIAHESRLAARITIGVITGIAVAAFSLYGISGILGSSSFMASILAAPLPLTIFASAALGILITYGVVAVGSLAGFSAAWATDKLDMWLTKRAIDRVAVKHFIESSSPQSSAYKWIIDSPNAAKLLLKFPEASFLKRIKPYQNIFEMALYKGSEVVINVLWEKVSLADRTIILDPKRKIVDRTSKKPANVIESRLKMFRERFRNEEQIAGKAFILGTNVSAKEGSLPYLPTEIRALILSLREDYKASKLSFR